jgi:hypothetical protein
MQLLMLMPLLMFWLHPSMVVTANRQQQEHRQW